MTNYVICTQVNNNQRVESSSQIRLSSTFLSFQENLCNNAHYSRISQKLQIKTETFIKKKITNYQFKKRYFAASFKSPYNCTFFLILPHIYIAGQYE